MTKEQTRIRILFVGAEPTDQPRIEVARELNEIKRGIDSTRFRDRFELISRVDIEAAELSSLLWEYRPDVFHFSGNVNEAGEISFVDRSGRTAIVGADTLVDLLSFNDSIKCIVVMASYSAKLAARLAESVDVAIGLDGSISVDAAIQFSSGFYRGLADGRSVLDAFRQGQVFIGLSGGEADGVMICVREGVSPEGLYLLEGMEPHPIPSQAKRAVPLSTEPVAPKVDITPPSRTKFQHPNSISALAASPDGRLLFTGSSDGSLRAWDLATGEQVHVRETPDGPIYAVVWEREGALLFGSKQPGLRRWEVGTEADFDSLGGGEPITAVRILADNSIVVGGLKGCVEFWDTDGHEHVGRHDEVVMDLVELSLDLVASCSSDGSVRLWTDGEGRGVALKGYDGMPHALAALHDGHLFSDTQLVVGSADGSIEVWSLEPPARLMRLEGHTDAVTAIAVLPNRHLVTASRDATLRVWDLDVGTSIATYTEHYFPVLALALLPDGRVASGSETGDVFLWDPASIVASNIRPVAGFQSDTADGVDQIGVSDEVRALCEIVISREVQPPLAIGLFGDWGSGKSFFMNMMRAKVGALARDAQLDELSICLRNLALELDGDPDRQRALAGLIDEEVSLRGRVDTTDPKVQRRRIRALADALWLRNLRTALKLLKDAATARDLGELGQLLGTLITELNPEPEFAWSALDGPALLVCLHTEAGSAWQGQVEASAGGAKLSREVDTYAKALALSEHIDKLERRSLGSRETWLKRAGRLRPGLEQLFVGDGTVNELLARRITLLCDFVSDMAEHADEGELRQNLRKVVDELWLLGCHALQSTLQARLEVDGLTATDLAAIKVNLPEILLIHTGRGSTLDDFGDVDALLSQLTKASVPEPQREFFVRQLVPILVDTDEPMAGSPKLARPVWISLARRLDELADGRYDEAGQPTRRIDINPFYGNVVQIEFNAWHYAESNLWASLVTQIFDGLANGLSESHGDDEPAKDALHRRRLLAKLETARTLRVEAEVDANTAERRATELRREYREAEATAERDRLALDQAQRDALNGSKVIKAKVKELLPDEQYTPEKLFDEALTAAGIELDTIAGLHEVGARLASFRGRFDAALVAIRQQGGMTWTRRFVIPLLLGLLSLFVAVLREPIAELVEWAWYELSQRIVQWATILATLVTFIRRVITPLESKLAFVGKIRELIKSGEQQLSTNFVGTHDIPPERREALDQAHAKTMAADAERDHVLSRLEFAQRRVQDAQQAVRDAQSGRRFYRFIEDRSESDDYRQHLGLIHLIRKDFEKLETMISSYVRERRSGDIHGVERLVLYIDDLDRCEEKRVVEILQAIHLLLAIPLFVVVVAVDSRWLLHALSTYYPQFTNDGAELSRVITPHNYLEKIFQIPFEITPMSEQGFERLIDSLTPSAEPKATRSASRQGLGEPRPVEAKSASDASTDNAPVRPEILATAETTNVSSVLNPAPVPKPIPRSKIHAREKLVISAKENAAIKRLYRFVRTPRATKRLVNVYRLLRVLEPPLGAGPLIETETYEYRGVLFLLGSQIGDPAETRKLFAQIEDGERTWGALLDGDARVIHRKVATELGLFGEAGAEVSLARLRPWIAHIRRFSFDTGASLNAPYESSLADGSEAVG